ncbi:EamA family transporter [Candidatus Dojkabacteria bacterium]|nr:EamA family transporter [Candidatus Dojkabacteria bacterium]
MYILYAFLSSIMFALLNLFSKIVIKYKAKNPVSISLIKNVVRLTLLASYVFIFGHGINIPGRNELIVFLLYGLFFVVGDIFYFKGMEKVDVSVSSPLFSMRTVFSVVLVYILGIETYSLLEYVLIFLLLPLAILISMKKDFKLKNFLNPGIAYLMVEYFSLAVISILTNRGQLRMDFVDFSFWSILVVVILNLSFLPWVFGDIKKIVGRPKKLLLPISILGIVSLAGSVLQVVALAGNVAVVTAIISLPLSLVLATVITIFKPGYIENNPWWVYLLRFVAAGCSLIIVLAVGLGWLR